MIFFFASRRRHTRYWRDWSSDVCSSDLVPGAEAHAHAERLATCVGERAAEVDVLPGVGGDQPGEVLEAVGTRRSVGHEDRKSVGEGESVDLGGRRMIKKKK